MRRRVLEVVGQTGDPRKLIAALGIEVCVAAASIVRPVPDAKVGKTSGIAVADGDIPLDVGHQLRRADIPLQRCLRDHVSEQ